MAHVKVIDVKSCELVWIIDYDKYVVGQSNSFNTNDTNLLLSLRLDRQAFRTHTTPSYNKRTAEFFAWYVVLQAENQNLSEDRSSDGGEETQNTIIGEATFKVKMEHGSDRKSCGGKITKRCTFTTEKMFNEDENDEEDFIDICRCKLTEAVKWNKMTLTCKLSYSNLKDVIPVLGPGRHVTIPVEKSELIPTVESFENLYLNKKYSDVTLSVNGTDYHAHKIVLAAHSKVFDAMFEHDMEEKKLNVVEIKDIDEVAFLQALRYMYTGGVENANELVYDTLLPVADRYDIKGLKTMCEKMLRKQLSLKTVVQILLMADSYNVDGLKTSSVEFLTNHSKEVVEVMSSEDWDTVMTRPRLMKDLLCVLMRS